MRVIKLVKLLFADRREVYDDQKKETTERRVRCICTVHRDAYVCSGSPFRSHITNRGTTPGHLCNDMKEIYYQARTTALSVGIIPRIRRLGELGEVEGVAQKDHR